MEKSEVLLTVIRAPASNRVHEARRVLPRWLLLQYQRKLWLLVFFRIVLVRSALLWRMVVRLKLRRLSRPALVCE